MGGLNSFPVIDTGNPFTVVDTYDATKYNNGARCPLGTQVTIPLSQAALASAAGKGSYLTVRYVRYNSTANPAMVAGAAPVYYTDTTLTTVSGVSTEALGGSVGFAAGWLLVSTNTTYSLGSGITAALLNGNYVWIAQRGYVPGAYVSAGSATILDGVIGAATNFSTGRITAGSAFTNTPLGILATTVSSSIADVYAILPW